MNQIAKKADLIINYYEEMGRIVSMILKMNVMLIQTFSVSVYI